MASAAAALQTIPGPTRKAPTLSTTVLETPALAPATIDVPSACSAGSCSDTDEEEIDESVPTTAITPTGRSTQKQKVSIAATGAVGAAEALPAEKVSSIRTPIPEPEEPLDSPPKAVPIIHYPKPNDILFGRSYKVSFWVFAFVRLLLRKIRYLFFCSSRQTSILSPFFSTHCTLR